MPNQPLNPPLPATAQPSAPDDPLERPVRKMHILWAVLILAAMTAGGIQVERIRIHDPWLADHEYTVFFLIYLGWLIASIIMIPIHEFAHALAGLAVGIPAETISLGSGPQLCRIPLGTTSLDIHCYPIKGLYRAIPLANTSLWRRAHLLAAGPATHFLACFAILALWFAAGWDQPEHFSIPCAFAVGFFACNLYLFVLNLIPRNTSWNGRPHAY